RGAASHERFARASRARRAQARRAREEIRRNDRSEPAVGEARQHGVVRRMDANPTDLVEAVNVLRDEVLDTAEHGDREPPGTEVFDALLRTLAIGGESVPGLDLTLHDSVSRRLAWGDTEEAVLADAEHVFDRLMIAID